MNNNNNVKLTCGIVGTLMSSVGLTATAEVEQIVSIVCTILGLLITIVSCVIIPIIKSVLKAKADGKITADEVNDIIDTADKGISEVKDEIDTINKDKEDK